MQSVKKNFFYNSFSSLLTILVPLITTPYITRVLGPSGLGIYSYNYSIATYFVTFAMLGLNTYGNRTIAMVRDDKEKCSRTFWEIYLMQLAVGVIVLCAYSTYLFLFAKYKLISFILSVYVISAMFDINWFFFGMELFKLTVARNIIIKILTTISIFLFVKNENDVLLYVVIIATGALLSQITVWPFLKKYASFTKVSFNNVLKHLKPNLILFIPAIAVSVYKLMDKVMLGKMSSMNEVGVYEAGEKLIQIPNTLIASLGTVMLPRMSNLFSKDRKSVIYEYIEKAIFVAMVIAVPISLGIMAVSKEIVPIFFGNGYEKCIDILQFLMPSCIFVGFANVIRTQYLIPKKCDDIYIRSVFLGAIVNFFANYFMIKKYYAVGAAVGTLLAETTVCIYQAYKIRKELDIKKYIYNSVPIVLNGVLMFIIVNGIEINNNSILLQLFVKVLVGIVAFVILMYITKWIKRFCSKY